MYRFKAILIKIQAVFIFLVEIDKPIIKFIAQCKGPRISQNNYEKKRVRGLTLLDFKTYYKAKVIVCDICINIGKKPLEQNGVQIEIYTYISTTMQSQFSGKDSVCNK